MDNMYLDIHFFFVPNRLVWAAWENFLGAQNNPGDSTDYNIPKTNSYTSAEGSLSDYFGIPIGTSIIHNVLPMRGYHRIVNDWYKDQNITNNKYQTTGNGPDTISNYAIQDRGKRHDYFTSCLPWPQRTNTTVSLPLGTVAPVVNKSSSTNPWKVRIASSDAVTSTNSGLEAGSDGLLQDGAATDMKLDPDGGLEADLTSATAATINQLREAVAFQEMYERDARGGMRLTEQTLSHWGVTVPDFRVQRTEYLGGGTAPVNVHPIAQTTASPGSPTNTDAQGNLAAFGTASFGSIGFNKSFTEHGFVIGIASVRADLTYQQGMEKMWRRDVRTDYYLPVLAHLGEQAVDNAEIYWTGTPATDDAVFGYQEAWAYERQKLSKITGQFRSGHSTPLDMWHMSQEFSSLPSLNDAFIKEDPPVDRAIAVTSEPHFLADFYFKYICARAMPVYSIPQLGSRF
jgi:hypothetical protein